MKQQCYVAAVYLNWLVLFGGVAFLVLTGRYTLALAWVVLVPLGLLLYIRAFPSISQVLGYGRVDDQTIQNLALVAAEIQHERIEVTLYTALGCPFCPIVKRRLEALQKQVNFTLREIDVTLRPGLLTGKHIRAVPVVEVREERIEGNATSEQLTELITRHMNQPIAT